MLMQLYIVYINISGLLGSLIKQLNRYTDNSVLPTLTEMTGAALVNLFNTPLIPTE